MHNLQRDTGARVRQVFVPAANAPQSEQPPAKEVPPAKKEGPQKLPEPASPAPQPGLSRAEIVRGFEYEKDKYVEFEPDELKQLAPKNSPDMQILEFVKFAEIDPVYLETSYYVLPDSGGAKPYALLFETLKKTTYAAVGEFVMQRRDQIIVLRPGPHGLIAHTLFYEDEVKRGNEYHVEAGLAAGKEMELAIKLVDALAGTFQPEKFKDQYRERLRQAISQKMEGTPVKSSESAPAKAPVVDIMAALRESLARARKPVARESKPAAAKRTKRASSA